MVTIVKVIANSSARFKNLLIIVFTLVLFSPMALPNVHSAPSVYSQEPVYLVRFIVNTTSDWCDVWEEGLKAFACNASIMSGEYAPDLVYSYGPGHIGISKKQYDQTPVSLDYQVLTLEGKRDGLISIDSGALGETTVDFYQYSGRWTKVSSITHLGLYRKENFTVDYSQVYASPSGSAEVEPVPSSLKNTVFAFYYPWYGDPRGPSGEVNHWESNHPHNSVLGTYDSNDERVIETQVETAKAAGIDGFIVSWWGVGTWEDKALPIILREAEKLNFKIAIYYEADRSENQSINDVVDELTYAIQKYSNNLAYLKANGVPVIFLYGVGAWDRPALFWTNVVSLLERRIGATYLVGDMDPRYAGAFDGFHWYWKMNKEEAYKIFESYKNNMRLGLKRIDWNQAIDFIKQGKNLPIEERLQAFTVAPGQDVRWRSNDLYLDRAGGKTYEDFWQTASSVDPEVVLITSWNEWHEGTEIEPSVEYGFAYINLTRRFISNYKGSSPPIYSTQLALLSDVDHVLRLGERNTSIRLINTSSNPATGVNLTLSLGEGLSLRDMERSRFYAYIEGTSPRNYHVIIPFLKPNEVLTFSVTMLASPGASKFKASAMGYSPSGVPSQAYLDEQVQVVSDRVLVNLSSASSRVEVGSEAEIAVSARYEYDELPLVGTTYLNDTLTKNSTGRCTYSARGVSDRLYGLTGFTSNAVTVTFDRITTSDTVRTLSPGSITASTALTFESDGQPVDEATVTVDGVPVVETIPGTFQITVSTWSPLYQLNVHIERPGFTPRNITLSGYAIGNIAVEATAAAVLLAVIMLLVRRRGV